MYIYLGRYGIPFCLKLKSPGAHPFYVRERVHFNV